MLSSCKDDVGYEDNLTNVVIETGMSQVIRLERMMWIMVTVKVTAQFPIITNAVLGYNID